MIFINNCFKTLSPSRDGQVTVFFCHTDSTDGTDFSIASDRHGWARMKLTTIFGIDDNKFRINDNMDNYYN